MRINLNKRNKIIGISALAVLLVIVLYFIFRSSDSDSIIINPKYGSFIVSVVNTGELASESSIDIDAPGEAMSIGIYEMKIESIVAEGKVVKAGDFVASLDKTTINQKLSEVQLNIQKIQTQYFQKQLDTTMTLSSARDNVENLKFSVEEKKLVVEQSKYEPPATQRQAELAYDREIRSYEQAKKNYNTQVKKAMTDLSIIKTDLSKEQNNMAELMRVFESFTIKAPANGMVIYAKDWSGQKRKEGSSVSAWGGAVAQLPDLTKMQSVTYVNEIDVQKIKKGQKVKIKLDAIDNKVLHGKVISVANIGEQRKDSKTKVFEAIIKIAEKDTSLLPTMTTSNEIFIKEIKKALYIPLECIHTYEKGKTKFNYIILKRGGGAVRQEVVLGDFNENECVILKGLEKDDDVFLSMPENMGKLDIKRLNKSKNDD
jgi:multidrug efflux pump subunit AcrA (membrane-fusion protein)